MSFPIFGILLHAVGALAAGICFTPQHKIRNWTYESFWFWMSFSSWLLLPVLGSLLFIPDLSGVLAASPRDAMWKSFGFGAAYGIGGMAFGFAIRHIGYSLTYALAVGLSAVLGFFLTPLIQGKLCEIISSTGGNAVLVGVAVGFLGIILCGLAGRRKEQENLGHDVIFKPAIGIPLCILAGVLSAFYSLALGSADPIVDEALQRGANPELVMNVRFLFASTGAFLSTLPVTLWQLAKKGSLCELAGAGAKGLPAPKTNIFWGCLAGILWYLQFIFYGMGHNRMDTLEVASWPLHMIMLILFSTLVAILRREWSGCLPVTKRFVTIAISLLILAVLVIGYGNHLNQIPATH